MVNHADSEQAHFAMFRTPAPDLILPDVNLGA
jgi:hypothetical protein